MATNTETREGMVVLKPIVERFVYADRLKGDLAREVVGGVVELEEKFGKDRKYFVFNEETGEINGSNLRKGVLTNMVLAKKGFRTPTYAEGMQLDEDEKGRRGKGVLTDGVYRDFGLVLFSANGYNENVAGPLVEEATKHRGLVLPVLIPLFALKPGKDAPYVFGDNDTLIVSGDEAVEELKRFDAVGNSGAQRLNRYGGGGWDAGWDYLDGSNADGREDWYCGEATRENLDAENIRKVESANRQYLDKVIAEATARGERALRIALGKE